MTLFQMGHDQGSRRGRVAVSLRRNGRRAYLPARYLVQGARARALPRPGVQAVIEAVVHGQAALPELNALRLQAVAAPMLKGAAVAAWRNAR